MVVGGVAVAGTLYLSKYGLGLPGGKNSNRISEVTGKVPSNGPGVGGHEIAPQTWADTVSRGDGITHSVMDYASQHGVKVSPQRAFEAFNKAREAGLINERNISNVAPMNVVGGIGFRGPGQTTFSSELVEFLNKDLGIM